MGQKPTSKVGKLAEDFAVNYITSKGYKVIDRNFRSRFGEVDIVALKDANLVFIEVKARWSLRFGRPEEAVTGAKIWKISKTAEYYSLMHPNLPRSLRIEVLALEINDGAPVGARIIPIG